MTREATALQRLVFDFHTGELVVRCLYRSKGESNPGTKARTREVVQLTRTGLQDALKALEGLHNSDIPASRSEAAIVSQYIRLRGRKPGEHSSDAGLSQIDYMTEYADEVIDRERIALLVAYVLERDGFAKDDTALSLVLRDEIAKLDKNAES